MGRRVFTREFKLEAVKLVKERGMSISQLARDLASTRLNEEGYHPDLIELQLAHAERNRVRAAYNRAQRLPERRKMTQAWADHLDSLRIGANVVQLRRAG